MIAKKFAYKRHYKECTFIAKDCSERSIARKISAFKLTRPKRAKTEASERARDECNYAQREGGRRARYAREFAFIIFFEVANSVASALNTPRQRMYLNEIVNLYSTFSPTD